MQSNLEEQLRRWREARGSKSTMGQRRECRTVKLDGREVLVLTKPKRPTI
jgi:hypothetical protein